MKTGFKTCPVIDDKSTFPASIQTLVLLAVGDGFPRKDLAIQLAEDLIRLPDITLPALVERLAQARGITLDPDTVQTIADEIVRERTDPCYGQP